MLLRGKLQYVGELKKGVSSSTGNEWAMREIGIEVVEHYGVEEPKTRTHKVLASLSGEEAINFTLQVGAPVQMNIHYSVREYENRLYTSNKAWGITLC